MINMCFITIEMNNANVEFWVAYTWWRLIEQTHKLP